MHVLQFQKGQLDEFCKLYSNNTEWQVSLPTLYRHLLFDKTSEAMFCYVPKSGCTHLKIMFLVNQGLISQSAVSNLRRRNGEGEICKTE